MQPTPNPLAPVRRALLDAGKELLRYAISEQTRPDPVRFGPDGRPLGAARSIDTPPDPRISYQPIHGCPWCQINLRLAGVVYALDRAIAFPPGTGAYLQMARNELVGVRAMISSNPGEIRALENPIGQIQLRLIAADVDIADLRAEVAHIMEIATRAAETPSAPTPTRPPFVHPGTVAIPTGERIYGTGTQPATGGANGASEPVDRVRDAGADQAAG